MNVKGAGPNAAAVAADTVRKVEAAGFTVSTATMDQLATEVGEKSLYGRTGGAATLAVGMAQIFSKLTNGRLLDIWYHFAIMFEALFILTTLDAGTRVGRYLLQDVLGHVWKPLGDTSSLPANILSSALVVAGWGYFLIQGVLDPLGGINSLWPLFGIANQLLAAIALCLATTVLLKTALKRRAEFESSGTTSQASRSPALMLITLIPLSWLLAVTFTAGWQKITHPEPRMGFLAAARDLDSKLPALQTALAAVTPASGPAFEAARKAVATNRALRFNNQLDAVVTSVFLVFAALIVLSAAWVWASLLSKRKPPTLTETEAVWLPGTGASPESGLKAMGVATLVLGLLRHWSGQSDVHRAQADLMAANQNCPVSTTSQRLLIDLPEVREDIEEQRRQAAPAQAYVLACSRRFDQSNSPCC
jgi:carbon starvation protein